jgi:hypothetical protein
MKKVIKFGLILYFLLVFPILFVAADFFILTSNPKIYNYIPQDADIIIEVNSKNFIKEVAFQRIYNEDYFLSKLPPTDEESLLDDQSVNTGIDFFSQIIIFRENWAQEKIWYAVLKVSNETTFNNYLISNNLNLNSESSGGYLVLQLTKSDNQEVVNDHLKNIAQNKIKSFDAKIDLSEKFNTDNEVNIYLSPQNSSQIIDGYLFLNFDSDKIQINGTITPIGNSDNKTYITHNTNKEKALSLRSSLNLFNSVYIFNDQILENIPNYNQLSLDFDGSKLITSNATNPIKAEPNINLKFEYNDSVIWSKYFTEYTSNENITLTDQKISMHGDVRSEINYELNPNSFKLFQDDSIFDTSDNSDTYFDLNINPNLFLKNTVFVEDSLNPPNLLSSIKINIIESLFEEMNYWESIDHISFNITDQPKSIDYLSYGEITFTDANGHSIIESIVITQNFMGTIGAFLESED